MTEIEVGEYVRTKDGIIGKIEQIGVSLYWLEDGSAYNIRENSNNHSKNIIDLIEKDDLVNKKLVSNVDKIDNTNIIEWEDGEMYSTSIENDKFIKEILTKEQYSQNVYKVVE